MGGRRGWEWDGGDWRGGIRILKFYADVHRSKRSGDGLRITFSTVGTTFKHIDGFSGIPAGRGDQVFVDTLPVQHTDG
jgi:hypothetical protein